MIHAKRRERKEFDRIFALGFAAGAGVVVGARFAQTLTTTKATTQVKVATSMLQPTCSQITAKALRKKRVLASHFYKYNAEMELMATYCAGDIGHA